MSGRGASGFKEMSIVVNPDTKMTIKLTDQNGFENAPFSYQIGTRVRLI
jgi:hypothetical protein